MTLWLILFRNLNYKAKLYHVSIVYTDKMNKQGLYTENGVHFTTLQIYNEYICIGDKI